MWNQCPVIQTDQWFELSHNEKKKNSKRKFSNIHRWNYAPIQKIHSYNGSNMTYMVLVNRFTSLKWNIDKPF